MSKRPFILCGLAVAAVSSSFLPGWADPSAAVNPTAMTPAAMTRAAATPTSAAEEGMKPSDHESLGKLIAAYLDARSSNKGLDKAQEKFQEELDKIGKRIKRDPLSLPADMGKALWKSYEYDKTQKLHPGKIDLIEETTYIEENVKDKVKGKIGYALWLPPKYDQRATKAYPLILCIPDQGEDPKTHITEKWTDPTVRDNAIIACVPMPTDAKTWLDAGVQGKESGVYNMLFTLGKILKSYAVDFDRIYIAGRGAGVEAAVTYAARFPDRFAGVIGRSGDAPTDLVVENMNNLPLFFAGAGGNATTLEEKLTKLGYTTFSRKDDATEADVWAWLQAHPRIPNPAEVVIYPANAAMHSFWLDNVATDATGNVYIKGKLDRKANTITVEGEGITKFTIFFDDDMMDLDKPVKVVANGADVSRTVQRSSLRALDFISNARSDPGRFYVNYMQYDLPPKPKPPAAKSGENK
jgi:pimeloyl-ACP methyl ester carboxylesterase